MNLRKPTSRWAFWLLAAALLLNGAMPLLASASAHAQGKSLVEVCTVYGVLLVAPPQAGTEPGNEPASDHAAPHASEHCALTALATLASPEPPAITTALVLRHKTPSLPAYPASQAPDACATWVARLKHGPPILS